MADSSENVRAEQFWFTLTTLGVNGSLIVDAARAASLRWLPVLVFSTLVSLFAAYLVVERSAFLVHGSMVPPDAPKGIATWKDKEREFHYKLPIVKSHLWFVWHEKSGSLFYLLLIVGSWLGSWIFR